VNLYFLGTGAGLPSKRRNVTSICLRLEPEIGQVWMFDCGEGTQHQVLQSPIKLSKLTKLFITHLHGDHIFGIPGLLGSRSFQGADRPFEIYGPPGLRAYVEACLGASATHLTYPLTIHELTPGDVVQEGGFTITVGRLRHGVECFGYRVVEADKPGRLRVEDLRAAGIPPGPIYQRLKRGEQVELSGGRIVDGRRFLDPPRPGRIVAILGDTEPCPSAHDLVTGADVLVHEATYADEDAPLAAAHHHSTCVDAARLARSAQVGRLLLSHISPRYDEAAEQRLLMQARNVFPATELAHDFREFPVNIRDE
jgi:ribonuclease Z